MRTPFLIALMLGFTGLLRAGEQTMRQRLIGLSAPERDEDLREVMKTMPGVELAAFDPESSEITLKYDTAKLLPTHNPKKPPSAEDIARRLDDLLRNASQGTFTLKPVSTVPKDKLTKIDIRIGILDCKACRFAAYSTVARIEGVERATVTGDGLLIAWIDVSKTNRDLLEESLKKARVELREPSAGAAK